MFVPVTVGMEDTPVRALDDTEDGAALSSPNSSAVSSFQMELYRNSRKFFEGDSEEDENGSTRKKLRLSKTQSAFLEDSFKEHTTLNPVSNSHFPSFTVSTKVLL